MKRTKLIFISLLMLILLSITAISAAESIDGDDALMTDDSNTQEISINNTDELSISNDMKEPVSQNAADEKLNANTGSFTELKNLIDNNNEVNLDKDYKYVQGELEDGNGIRIDKTMTIDGHGHTINAAKEVRIFISDGGHVTLKNIIFKNSKVIAGSGGAINLKNSEYTIENCTFSNSYAYDDGGAIYIDSDSKATIKNSKFYSNEVESASYSHDNGGAIYSAGTLNVESCIFQGNNARGGHGGAIYSEGNFEITGHCSFFSNFAYNDGGAIYAKKINQNIENIIFDTNRANNGGGGAIYLNSKDSIQFINCVFKDNIAIKYNGGAILSDGSGKTTLKNCNFSDNKAQPSLGGGEAEFVDYKGGAVYADNELEIDNCIFKENYALDCGGAVYANKGLRWGENPSIFIGNRLGSTTADTIHRKGGAVYATKFITDAYNLVFINNTGEYGGAVYIHNKNYLTFESCYFENNIGSATKDTTSLNGQGGAIYMDSSSSELTLKNNIFINNRAKEGQAIYNCGEYKTIENNYWGTNNPDFETDLIIEWHRFTKNDKHKDSSPLKLELSLDESAFGMGDNYQLTARFTYSNGNIFTGNLANVGAMNFVADKKATFSTKTVQNSKVTTWFKPLESGEYKLSAKFGNTVLATASFKVMGAFEYLQYQIDKAGQNDVIDLKTDVNYNPNEFSAPRGIIISKNLTINGNGYTINGTGLIRIFNIMSGHVKINNITFVEGKADYGGAIYASSADGVVISNCEFKNNKATFNGGAIYLKSSNSNITGCRFYNNQISQNYGSAVSCEGQNDCIISCEFINNHAKGEGGSVSITGKNSLVSNSKFINNTAYAAGAIYWSAEYGKVEGCDFINNSAENDGGAVYWIGDNGVIDKSTFKGNSAKNNGGAIRADDNLLITIKNSCFLNNREKSDKIIFEITKTNINLVFTSNNRINAIYASSVDFTNVTYWNGGIVNTDVAEYHPHRATGQKVNIEIFNENNNLVKNMTLITDAKGIASYVFTELDDGIYTFSICHYEDSYYGYYGTSPSEFTLERKEIEGNISFGNLQNEYVYGNITVNFTVENRHEVRATITDEQQTRIFLDEIVKGDNVTFSLPAGKTYRITLSNVGSQTQRTTEVTGTFTIVKATPEIEIDEIGTVEYGNNVTVRYTSGHPYLLLIGVKNIGTGKKVYDNLTRQNPIVLTDLDIGDYQVEIYFSGDENFTSCNTTINFKVTGYNLNSANVSVSEATYGEESIITVNAETDGEYTVDINGTKVNVTVAGGTGIASIFLDAGNYYANLTFNNPNYHTTVKNTVFNVLKAESFIYLFIRI